MFNKDLVSNKKDFETVRYEGKNGNAWRMKYLYKNLTFFRHYMVCVTIDT